METRNARHFGFIFVVGYILRVGSEELFLQHKDIHMYVGNGKRELLEERFW